MESGIQLYESGIQVPLTKNPESRIQSCLGFFYTGRLLVRTDHFRHVREVNHHIYGKWQTIASLLSFVVLCVNLTCEQALLFARSSEARFAPLNRRACSQASVNSVLHAIRRRRGTFIATAFTDSRLSVS